MYIYIYIYYMCMYIYIYTCVCVRVSLHTTCICYVIYILKLGEQTRPISDLTAAFRNSKNNNDN